MPGTELKTLSKYDNLRTLKFGGNLCKDYSELESLVSHYRPCRVLINVYRRD
jgi:hypothetical protein